LSLFARSTKTRYTERKTQEPWSKKIIFGGTRDSGFDPWQNTVSPVGRKTPPIAFFETENADSSLGHVAVRFRKLETAAPEGENARFAREEDKLSF
jgi:hypothetical protein